MRNKKLSIEEIAAFCTQINLIVKAGLPTYYGISLLMDDATDDETKAFLETIYKPMEAGLPLHEALAKTSSFPDYMVNEIKLGETTGRLEDVLDSLIEYYERESALRKSIRNAVSYPLIMTVLMSAVIIVLITKVLPVFSQIYEELGSELTGFAKRMLDISTIFDRYLAVFVALFILLIIFAIICYYTNLGAMLLHGKKISMSIASGRFANCMHLALSSGLDTDEGLALSKELINDKEMKRRIDVCRDYIDTGYTFIESIVRSEIFSNLYSSLLTIGYKTGSMDDVMLKIGKAYEEETKRRLDRFISILEPTLVIILSLFIGMILIAFLLPLLGIMSSIG